MKILTLLLTGSLALSTAAYGQPLKERGGYVGGAYGVTSYEDDDLFSGIYGNSSNFLNYDLDSGGQAWQLYGGYRFFKYFAVEGRYTDFGDYSADFTGRLEDQPFSGTSTVDFSALTVHAIGILPFGQSGFDIYGQLGLGIMFYEGEERSSLYGKVSEDDEAGTLSIGLGARYTPPRFQAITIQLGYDYYGFEVEGVFDENYNQSISMGKLGVQYNF